MLVYDFHSNDENNFRCEMFRHDINITLDSSVNYAFSAYIKNNIVITSLHDNI